MAVKLPGFRLLPAAGPKSRVLAVALVMGLLVAVVIGVARWTAGTENGGSAQLANAPAGLQSVPGGESSPEYYRAVMAANAEASRQAQMTGGSAVPTLLNVPTGPVAQAPFPVQQNCTVMCPDPDRPNVKTDVEDLLKTGKLSKAEGNALLALSDKNVPVDEYAAALDALVRSGKLSPAEARALLEKYRLQHQNAALEKSGAQMDGLMKEGRLSLDEANRLLALQKGGITAASYGAALASEVKKGRLSAAAASALLGQYAGQQAEECRSQGIFQLAQLVGEGAMTAMVQKDLAGLQMQNVPLNQYLSQLQTLVTQGKLTPATSDTLGKAYRAQRACAGTPEGLTNLLQQQEALAARCLAASAARAGLTQVETGTLNRLMGEGVSWTRWEQAAAALQKAGRLTAEQEQQILSCYRQLLALKQEIAHLQALQANNATPALWADALKSAVQKGLLSPDAAAGLMQDYTAMITPVAAGLPAEISIGIPGAGDFAKLQQRVQEAAPSAGQGISAQSAAQFQAAVAEENARNEKARQERLQQLAAAMTGQAQTLVAAWTQLPAMRHVEGQAARAAGRTAGRTAPLQGVPGTAGPAVASAVPSGPPLIKAGTIFFAVLTTAVNSDYPDTPVMATLVQGPFRGATLLGKLALAHGQDRVSLNFTLMDSDNWLRAKPVSAYAIDPETARTVMATSVDHHYLLRYGGLFAASFLTGYAGAIQNAGTSTTGIFGTSTSHPELSPGNRIAVGLGQVGTALTANMQGYLNTPSTVKIASGVGIGVLFVADVTKQDEKNAG